MLSFLFYNLKERQSAALGFSPPFVRELFMNTLISAARFCFVPSFAMAALLALSFDTPAARAEGPVVLHRGNIAALNPQPLPPRYLSLYRIRYGLGGTVSLNPQPLPPRWIGAKNLPRPGGAVSLNPQPLPPKAIFVPLLKTR
jgi:hypothetical protein